MVNLDIKKILIVEDDPNFQDMLELGLKTEPAFSLMFAKDGEEGLDKILKEKPDLIILDIMMPKMDGIELANILRKQAILTPIIFFTNVSDAGGIDKAFSVPKSRYIVKSSMHVDEIIKAIKNDLGITV